MGLRNTLYDEIKGAYPNMFSLERVEATAKRMGQKFSTAERRCRKLEEDGLIWTVKNEKGFNMGYMWIEQKPITFDFNKDKEQGQLFSTRSHPY